MGTVMKMADGKCETIFDFSDFKYWIEKYMGYEAVRFLEDYVQELEEAADETKQKVNTDLNAYEASLESNTTCFNDILEMVAKLETELENSKRINRQVLLDGLKEIKKSIKNQI